MAKHLLGAANSGNKWTITLFDDTTNLIETVKLNDTKDKGA